MLNAIAFDSDLLARYNRPIPRYTSYPTALQFDPQFSADQFVDAARKSNDDPIPLPLSLYLHIPFCISPCFYCGCNRVITRDYQRAAQYLDYLENEIVKIGELFDRDRPVMQLHLGGGTPNFLTTEQIGELLEIINSHYSISHIEDRDYSIEIDPRSVDADTIAALGWMGFNRASLGVQDFDSDVQNAINRIQPVEQTLQCLDACRKANFSSINVDLIYGLPKQTLEGFAATLDTIIHAKPDRLAVYSYAHMPQLFRGQRQINERDLPTPSEKLELLQLAISKLLTAGYRYIGMDHFALPDDRLCQAQHDGSLQRNFMGYTTHGDCDLIGLGMSAISRVGRCFSQNIRTLPQWQNAIKSNFLAVTRGMQLDDDDLLREQIIQSLMCLGKVDIPTIEQNFDIDFFDYFSASIDACQPLVDDGLVDIHSNCIQSTAKGRLLLRHIAACFDRYLLAARPAQYSKAI